VRVLLPLIIILAAIAIVGFWLARQRTRDALAARRRAEQLEANLDMWVEAEREGLARRRETESRPNRED
jgi:hypothetical protein